MNAVEKKACASSCCQEMFLKNVLRLIIYSDVPDFTNFSKKVKKKNEYRYINPHESGENFP